VQRQKATQRHRGKRALHATRPTRQSFHRDAEDSHPRQNNAKLLRLSIINYALSRQDKILDCRAASRLAMTRRYARNKPSAVFARSEATKQSRKEM